MRRLTPDQISVRRIRNGARNGGLQSAREPQAGNGLIQGLGGLGQELLEEALRRVRARVPAQQWDAFRLTALEGKSGAEAAEQIGMLVATVYTAKSKVQKAVREEVRRLEGAPPD